MMVSNYPMESSVRTKLVITIVTYYLYVAVLPEITSNARFLHGYQKLANKFTSK